MLTISEQNIEEERIVIMKAYYRHKRLLSVKINKFDIQRLLKSMNTLCLEYYRWLIPIFFVYVIMYNNAFFYIGDLSKK